MIELDVEDHGSGIDAGAARRGLGIIAMRERAEMLGGTIEFLRPPAEGGTLESAVLNAVPHCRSDAGLSTA